jgi:hypothetical protein
VEGVRADAGGEHRSGLRNKVGDLLENPSALNTAIGSPCSSTTYRIASLHFLVFPEPSGTPVARPPLSIRIFKSGAAKIPASIRLEIVHDLLGPDVGFHKHVLVIGQQADPPAVRTYVMESLKHSSPATLVQKIWRLVHQLALSIGVVRMGWQQPGSRQIVVRIDGTRFLAMQVRAIAGEGDEVPHGRWFWNLRSPYGRGSVTYISPNYHRQRFDKADVFLLSWEHYD